MTTTINASPTNGIVQTADGSGVMKLQSNGVTTNALAWVSFTGSTAVIKSSYNVSSVTRNSAGDYTVNYASALVDANYSLVGSASATVNVFLFGNANTAQTVNLCRVATYQVGVGTIDPTIVSVAIFGN